MFPPFRCFGHGPVEFAKIALSVPSKLGEFFCLKALSYQSSVLTAIPRRPKNADRRGARSMIPEKTQWHRRWTLWDRIKRQPTVRTSSMLKTNAVARRCHGNGSKRAQWDRRVVAIAAQLYLLHVQRSKTSAGAHKSRCANAVDIRGVCTDIVRRSLRCRYRDFFYAYFGPNIDPLSNNFSK